MKTKIKFSFLIIILMLSIFAISNPTLADKQNKTELYFFYGQACPHCAAAEPFLEELQQKYSQLEIVRYEVYFNETNRDLLKQFATACSSEVEGVPTFFIDADMIAGYSSDTSNQIEDKIQQCISSGQCVELGEHLTCTGLTNGTSGGTSPLVEGGHLTLPTVMGAAALDAINPCEIAILIILLTTILAAGKRWRVLGAGLAFSSAIFASYLMMGLGLYAALRVSGIARIFFYIVTSVAFIAGLLSVRSYFKYKPGMESMEMPTRWRPMMKRIVSSVASIPGAAFVGFLCSLFLLPCSSGPYLVILGLLAKETTRASAIPLLILYNIIFIMPMILITLGVYAGASIEKVSAWKERNVKRMHLASGILMLGLAAFMVISMLLGWI